MESVKERQRRMKEIYVKRMSERKEEEKENV